MASDIGAAWMIDKQKQSTAAHLGILIFASAVLTAPLILFGASSHSDDALDHARWYSSFSSQLWAGDLYPRWLSDMNLGLGSPAFYYYPPLPYYVTSLVHPFFRDEAGGWHQIGISAAIAVLLSGIFAYVWLRTFSGERAALMGAILFMVGPYHLASDLYVRFAFAELWSFVWMPLVLYFTQRLAMGKTRAVVGIAAAYALLTMTHLPTTMLFSPCLLTYAFFLMPQRRLATTAYLAGSMLLGGGIAAVYVYPALTMQEYVFLDQMSTGYFSYANWLIPSTFAMWTSDKVVITLLALDLIIVAVAAFYLARTPSDRKLGSLWLVIAGASFLMMTDVSRPVWWLVAPLQKAQFPFRFGTILTVAVTALLTLALSSFELHGAKLLKGITALLILGWMGGTIWAASAVWSGFSDDAERASLTRMTPDMPEYRTRWNQFMRSVDWETSIDEDYWDREMNSEFVASIKGSGLTREGPTRARLVQGTGTIAIKEWTPGTISLDTNADASSIVEVGHFYFPTWKAKLDGNSSVALEPRAPHGLISFSVPGGQHDIELTLGSGPQQLIGKIISSISLVLFALLAGILYRSSTPRTDASDSGYTGLSRPPSL